YDLSTFITSSFNQLRCLSVRSSLLLWEFNEGDGCVKLAKVTGLSYSTGLRDTMAALNRAPTALRANRVCLTGRDGAWIGSVQGAVATWFRSNMRFVWFD